MTAAVKPTPVEPLPVVLIVPGLKFITTLKSYDLAVPGSPTISKLISPLR